MMDALIHCIYASTASSEFKEGEIPLFLERIRSKNARLTVTGMLLYIEGSFFQVLEGPSSVVDNLYASIERDSRHERVTRIIREPIARRSFGEWTMGFDSVSLQQSVALAGANDFFDDAGCLHRLDGGRAKKLLYSFREGHWRTEHTGMFATPGRVR